MPWQWASLGPVPQQCQQCQHRLQPPSVPSPPVRLLWPPSWNMTRSTFINPCNFSGYYNYDAFPALADFGIVSYDWANAKEVWAKDKPMTCQGTMVAQALQTKQHNPSAKVLVYRNLVKALPWMEEVREKLEDPAYFGWFMQLKPELLEGSADAFEVWLTRSGMLLFDRGYFYIFFSFQKRPVLAGRRCPTDPLNFGKAPL